MINPSDELSEIPTKYNAVSSEYFVVIFILVQPHIQFYEFIFSHEGVFINHKKMNSTPFQLLNFGYSSGTHIPEAITIVSQNNDEADPVYAA